MTGAQTMNPSILDFRVREEMAGAVLKEVAALEPAERLQAAQEERGQAHEERRGTGAA